MDKSKNNFKLVAGLGNPGEKYSATYHNVGFIAVDFLASACLFKSGSSEEWRRPGSKQFYFMRCGEYVWIKPATFMNESGIAIREALSFFSIIPEEIVVIHDESDLSFGEYKISRGAGAAGHHGVESVIQHLGTNAFTRIRIGIRTEERAKAGEVVLSQIPKSKIDTVHSVASLSMEKLMEKA